MGQQNKDTKLQKGNLLLTSSRGGGGEGELVPMDRQINRKKKSPGGWHFILA